MRDVNQDESKISLREPWPDSMFLPWMLCFIGLSKKTQLNLMPKLDDSLLAPKN